MRPVLLLTAVVVAAVTALGAGAAVRPSPIQFGISGGNIPGSRVSIKPSGKVTVTGRRMAVRTIKAARVRRLGREIRRAHLSSQTCAGSMPDLATKFVQLGNRSFTVRGDCEPRFDRVLNDLTNAVHLGFKVQPVGR